MAPAAATLLGSPPPITDRIALGALTHTFPPELVDEVIEATGRPGAAQSAAAGASERLLRVGDDAVLLGRLRGGDAQSDRGAGRGLSRTGEERYGGALPRCPRSPRRGPGWGRSRWRSCSRGPACPLATPATAGAFYRARRRLVSLDGTTIDVADTAANAESFGRAGTGRGGGSARSRSCGWWRWESAGTHAIVAAGDGFLRHRRVSLARQGSFGGRVRAQGMLCSGRSGVHRFLPVVGQGIRHRCGPAVAGQASNAPVLPVPWSRCPTGRSAPEIVPAPRPTSGPVSTCSRCG